jgi:thiol-disulfide isomerase/thioredoxin
VTAGIVVCLVVLAAATGFGLVRRRRDGRLAARSPAAAAAGPQLGAAELGQPLGERATLLQFSSEFCSPCRATRKVLAEVAAGLAGVRHVEVDAAAREDLVRLLHVRRTPTVFVLGPDGRVTQRGSGLMRREDVLAALGEAG